MNRLEQARWLFWHALYGLGRLVTYGLFVLLDRPSKKRGR